MRPRETSGPAHSQRYATAAFVASLGVVMNTFVAVLLALAVGSLLTFGATRATASVHQGRTFLRWMVVVFATYLALITLPVVIGF